jgi:hypothetical protein
MVWLRLASQARNRPASVISYLDVCNGAADVFAAADTGTDAAQVMPGREVP